MIVAPSLDGKVIAFVESRMASEMASLIQRHGGVPFPAPVLQENYLEDDPQVNQLVNDICDGAVQVVVLLTGVGTQALVRAAAALGKEESFLTALDQRTIIARSPKPARVLRHYKIHIDVMPPEPFTSQDLLDAIHDIDLAGKELAVQAYGAPNGFLVQRLRDRGATVREVTLYSWGLPQDQTQVIGMIDGLGRGEIDAVAFTSQPQVKNLISIASQAGTEEILRGQLNGPLVAVASVGPVCSRRLREAGINVDVEPEHPHMGNLVLAIAEYFERAS